MITYDRSDANCQACYFHVACAARVEEIRPTILRLLDKVSDKTGRPMSDPWRTRGERKTRKKNKVDEEIAVAGLIAPDSRTAPLIRRAARKGIDPFTADHADLAELSPNLAVAISTLKSSPASAEEISTALMECRGIGHHAAERTSRQLISFLKAHNRARVTDNMVELL